MKKTLIAGLALAAVAGCGSTPSTEPPQAQPSSGTTQHVSTTTSAREANTSGYLSATRQNTTDQVPDAKLIEIGRTLCAELRRGEWKNTVLDDSPMVAGISVQMRINAGFAAVHYLCPDQEADYLRRSSGN
ncbi:hypothetical protein FK268_09155 [Tsukamurella sputi]|uniref:DUF732 domain-containing protein n=1 Tax=Tsukamurella sputi TaxID=2591848 RepID=A0A5C5RQJ3_9ACTN|nr:DUF732 domain-containing protein [Tsukamurella sputi]TWS25349.1 hypothetical protein FK268_09155 [Tsukamurella sputi]